MDDEDGIREIIADELVDMNCEVEEASGGYQATELAKIKQFDLVISDLRMPEGSGEYLLNFLKTRGLSVPRIIIVSAFSDLSIESVLAWGAESMFTKPFQRDHFYSRVQQLLSGLNYFYKVVGNDELNLKPVKSFQLEKALSEGSISLGRGGAFIRAKSDDIPNVGSNLTLSFALKSGAEGRVSGIVQWTRKDSKNDLKPTGFGLEWLEMNSEMHTALLEIVDFQKLLPFIPN